MKTILKSDSGMTLMETIIALLIFGVLATTVTAIMLPVLNSYIRANDLAELTVLVENIGSEIVDDLKQSTALAEINGDEIAIKIESNTIYYQLSSEGILEKKFSTNNAHTVNDHGTKNFFPVYDKKYYKNKKLKIRYENIATDKNPVYEVKIDVEFNNGESVLKNTFTANPLVLNQYGKENPTPP